MRRLLLLGVDLEAACPLMPVGRLGRGIRAPCPMLKGRARLRRARRCGMDYMSRFLFHVGLGIDLRRYWEGKQVHR